MGSFPRVARSPAENDRSVAIGTVRSAILTYFGQIVIQEPAATKGSCPYGPRGSRPEPIAPEAQARSHGQRKHTGCRPATQKHPGDGYPAPRKRPGKGKFEEEAPWLNDPMTASTA